MWFNEILFLCDSSEDSKQDFMKKLIPIQSPSFPYNNSLAYGASFVYWDRRAHIFLSVIWLPHDQLWPVIEMTASLTRY